MTADRIHSWRRRIHHNAACQSRGETRSRIVARRVFDRASVQFDRIRQNNPINVRVPVLNVVLKLQRAASAAGQVVRLTRPRIQRQTQIRSAVSGAHRHGFAIIESKIQSHSRSITLAGRDFDARNDRVDRIHKNTRGILRREGQHRTIPGAIFNCCSVEHDRGCGLDSVSIRFAAFHDVSERDA